MSKEYDSAQIRALAQRVSRAAKAVGRVKSQTLQNASAEIASNLRGSAADALADQVNDLKNDVNRISDGLTAISNELYKLAQQVEYADRLAAEAIKGQ